MSSLIDSTAQFESQMRELGIQQTLLDGLKQHGVRTLSQLAFSVGQPGQPILDQSVEALVQAAVGRAPSLTEAACLKRLAFEAQTYLTATLRQAVDRSEDAVPRKVPMAELCNYIRPIRLNSEMSSGLVSSVRVGNGCTGATAGNLM